MKTFRPHRGLGRTRRHALKKQWVDSLWRQENPATSEPVLWGAITSSPFIEHQLVPAVSLSVLCNNCRRARQFSFFHPVVFPGGSSESRRNRVVLP